MSGEQEYQSKFKPYSSVLEKGMRYVEKRKTGEIKSLRTPWPSFNEAGVAGLEWGSMLTIGARPGAGKTMISSQILRESHRLNSDQSFNILEFQFEMGDEQYASRQFAAEMALDYGHILSTNRELDNFTMKRIIEFTAETKRLEKMGLRRDIVSESLTEDLIRKEIEMAYVRGGSKPLLITIDHSWLIKKGSRDKDKFDVLYNTTEMLMKLKNQLPIIVIMLTQLNRSIEDAARRIPASIHNYPTSGDIFGGDALMQGSDMVVVLSRPFKLDIKLYGPYAYHVLTDDVIMHLIKVRNNGDEKNNMIFMKMEGQNQRMIEVAPPKAERPEGNYQRFSQRTGGRQIIESPIGTEI
jgi:replicative DNA helicase